MCQGSFSFCLNVSQNTLTVVHCSLSVLNCKFLIHTRHSLTCFPFIISLTKTPSLHYFLSLLSEILLIWKSWKLWSSQGKLEWTQLDKVPWRVLKSPAAVLLQKPSTLSLQLKGYLSLSGMRLHFFRWLIGIERNQVVINSVSMICFTLL